MARSDFLAMDGAPGYRILPLLRLVDRLLELRLDDRLDFRRDELFRDDLRDGTFAPFLRASLRPMATACLRLFTFLPEPLFSVPRFRRRIADSTLSDAFRPYLAMMSSSPAMYAVLGNTDDERRGVGPRRSVPISGCRLARFR
jgi:hypothetical protein